MFDATLVVNVVVIVTEVTATQLMLIMLIVYSDDTNVSLFTSSLLEGQSLIPLHTRSFFMHVLFLHLNSVS